jgi:hypothetical protein
MSKSAGFDARSRTTGKSNDQDGARQRLHLHSHHRVGLGNLKSNRQGSRARVANRSTVKRLVGLMFGPPGDRRARLGFRPRGLGEPTPVAGGCSRGVRHLAGAHVALSRLIGIRLRFARAGHELRTMPLLGWRHQLLIGGRPRDNRNFAHFGRSVASSP